MKTYRVLLVLLTLLLTSAVMFSQTIPPTINYQGVLKDASGVVVANGDYNLTFKLYDVALGGSAIWTETKLINIVDGIINTALGSVTPIMLPFDQEYWLGVTIEAESEMAPRLKLSSVPFSYMSMNVPDGTITSVKIADGHVVKSINGLKDNVDLLEGTNVTLTPIDNNIMISSSATGDNWGIQNVITDGTLSGDGTVSLPLRLSQQSATPGQVLKWSGSTWQPDNDLTGSSQWQQNSAKIYYDAGEVGVGLNNPTGMMEIYGNSVDSYPTLLLSEADGYARISFRTMAASNKHWVLAGYTNLTDATSQWHLNYNNGTIGKNIFSVYGDSKIGFDGDVGIGTQTPSAKLEVAGQVKITGGSPGSGKVLTSDATGLSSWQTPQISPWIKNGNHIYYNTGNVAIGMNFPRYELTIYQDNDPHIGFYNSTSGTSGTDGFTISTGATGSPVWIWNWENSNMHFGTNNTNRMIIDADGHVSMMRYLDINTDGTYGALYVKGKQALWWDGTYFSWGYDGTYNYFADKVTIGNAANPAYMLYVQGNAYATGTWSSSDARFKKNITSIDNAIDRIMKVRGASFEFRRDEFADYHFTEGTQFGFIAQELENIFPEVVKTETNGYKSINYSEMIPVLLEAIKEQQTMIQNQQKFIENLTERIEVLEKR